MLPNFLIIGAMKAGTTTLYRHLQLHPQIFLSTPKEPHFFSENWEKGRTWYERFFAEAETRRSLAVGEASTTYTRYPLVKHVPERIASLTPDIKLIYILRDPYQRMISNYIHSYYKQMINQPLTDLIDLKSAMVIQSQYYTQVKHFYSFFSPEKLLILKLDDLAASPQDTIQKVITFLGLSPDFNQAISSEKHNQSANKFRGGKLIIKMLNSRIYKAIVKKIPTDKKKLLKPYIMKKIDSQMTELTREQKHIVCPLFIQELKDLSALITMDFRAWVQNLEHHLNEEP